MNKNKMSILSGWKQIEFPISLGEGNTIFQIDSILIHLRSFWKDTIYVMKDNEYVLLLIKIHFNDGIIYSLGKMNKLNKDVRPKMLMESIGFNYNKILDSYNVKTPIGISFHYLIKKGSIIPSFSDFVSAKGKLDYILVKKMKLPIAYRPEDYGKIITKDDNFCCVATISPYSTPLFLKKGSDSFGVNKKQNIILQIFKKGENLFKINMINSKSVVSWVDEIINNNTLIRTLGDTIYEIVDGEVILIKEKINSKPILPLILPKKGKRRINNNFLTMDIETVMEPSSDKVGKITNNLIMYLICLFDGKNSYSFFNSKLTDPNGSFNLVKDLVKFLKLRKFRGTKIYLHNFAKFDSYFLLKHLVKLGECNALLHDGDLLSLTFKGKGIKHPIIFKDSLKLLPSSLKKLSESFKIDNPKGIFPVLFSDINYKGRVPNIEYFKNISIDIYNKYVKEFSSLALGNVNWNFKKESINYCKLDCISLYQIIFKFNRLIFDKFNINISKYPTLSSLAFAIYRTHYLLGKNIHSLTGSTYHNIALGYRGGAVDMYIPKNPKGKKIYAYDVNSLYPFVMKEYLYPIGNPTYFKGNIFLENKDAFGFFWVKVKSPDNLLHPILPTYFKNRSVNPLGNWEGMYFSQEIKNAKNYGYEFEVLWGYTFEKGYIFKDYIDNLYNLRLSFPKSDPMNMIAKLLLNSLYGRFGMKDTMPITTIINKSDYNNCIQKHGEDNIDNIIDLGNHQLLQFNKSNIELLEKDSFAPKGQGVNVNIAIASAVTAYARIHMSQFKNNILFPNLYYSDTDSVYFDGPLDDSFISDKELGLLKLEGIWDDAVFLSPKVYALRNQDKLVIKVKGVKREIIDQNITFDLLEGLLLENNSISLNQNKWFRSWNPNNESIQIKNQIYTLVQTDNKRELVFDNGKAINTKPFILNL